MSLSWIAILRDALAIVVARSLVKGVLVAAQTDEVLVARVDLLVLAVGFCAVGCAGGARRAARVALTALSTWGIGVVVAVIRGAVVPYGPDLVRTLLTALVGGLVSLLIVRRSRAAVSSGPDPGAGAGPPAPPGS